ncbi:disease resistance protein RPV1-like isoform X2 [Mangifera indica]|uniref:disease resistance protein RPV1-like isoform X2 n=1 Tax=Mangifera indica TaxID=29780 RepID=UPI001CF9B03C|nr:disease resistance protein RPV1-like isoform X2 [Mangifera indica]
MASSSNNPEVKHDVFLSFRGEDTRNNFTSHLEVAFGRVSIKTFIDDKLRRGEEISPSLLEAIEQSKISVIILSENYASSRWCLEELAKILDCKKRFGQMVIPIFYHVDPSHVRNQTGAFGEAFNALKKRFEERLAPSFTALLQRFIFGLYSWFYPKKENDELQRWKTALIEVGNLSGSTTDSKRESELIGEIVMDVLKRLTKMSSSDHSDLIGVEFTIKEIESLLKIGSSNVCIVGIWGFGGIGKTSISRAIFNKQRNNFDGSFFAENVREESNNCRKLIALREELFCKILEDRYANIGLTLTTKRLACKKVFIVFDDVTSLDQIKNLIGDPKYLGVGSQIIITSRDKQVLNNICEPDKIYKLEGLFYHEAFQLFSRYAFRPNGDTTEEYMKLSKVIITYAKGVPLALKVLGSSLLGKTKPEWESTVKNLETSLHKDIQNVLKISYDGLDPRQKELFLDIACFFKGRDRDLIMDVMDSYGYSANIGLSVLIDKSLIIVLNNKITMHDLLEEMGREIVRQESIEDPGKRSRLFHPEDIYHVLTKNKGTEAIKSICLDVSQVKEIHLTPYAFSKMQNLKYLKVYSSHDGEDFNQLYGFQDVEFVFLELKYLSWHRYPWTSLPSKFHLVNLVALEMPGSNIEQLWPEVQNLVNLKHIDLSESKHLLKCPDLTLAENIETLNLEGCTSLIEIHSSIQNLNKLSSLNLRGCKSLCSIPSAICSKSLRTVVFTGCSNLDTMPSLSRNVEKLYLDGSAIRELPSSIENLSKLVTLNLHGCTRLESLPSSIGELKALENLTLKDCSRLKNLPSSVFSLSALGDINLSGCSGLKIVSSFPCNIKSLCLKGSAIQELPLSIQDLSKLKKLDLTDCWSLESLPSSIGKLKSLEFLDLSGCLKLNSLPNEIGNLEALWQLYAKGTGIREVPLSIVSLNNLDELSFAGSKGEEHVGLKLPLLSGLQCLRSLNLSDCCITELPSSLGKLTSLKELHIGGNKFESIPESIINLCNLFNLDLRNCDMLKSLPELPSSIRYIQAQNCKSLELFSPTGWRSVNFTNCFKLDQSALEDRVKLALQNIQSIETDSFAYACFPGSSIPEWFTFRSKGSLIKPPQGWLNYKRVPLCFCIVVSLRDDHEKSKKFELHCDVHFKSDSGPYRTSAPWISWRGRSSIDSDHIYFLPYSVVWPVDNEVSFQFYIGDGKGLECYEVKECGVLFYRTPKSVAEPYHKGMDWCPFHSKCTVLLE